MPNYILIKLFAHNLTYYFRHTKFDGHAILRILLALSLFYICLIALTAGKNFTAFLHENSPDTDPISFFNYLTLYLFFIDFITRLFLQKHSFVSSKAYFHLPVNRNQIICSNLILVSFGFNNLYLLLFIIPFSANTLIPAYGIGPAMFYLLRVILLLLFLTYFSSLVKHLIRRSLIFIFIPLFWIAMILLLRMVFNLTSGSTLVTIFPFDKNYNLVLSGILLIVDIGLVWINYTILKADVYTIYQERFTPDIPHKSFAKLSILKNFLIPYGNLELRLLMRNRRLRSILIVPVFFLLLTIYFFSLKNTSDYYSLLFWFVSLTGILGYSYAQNMHSWESSYYDFIAAVKFDVARYLRTKYFIAVFGSLVLFLLTIPVIVIFKIDVYLVFTSFLYNIGIGYFFVFYTAAFNDKRIDLKYSLLFNYQGNSSIQVISISIAILIPLLMFYLFSIFLDQTYSLLLINVLSIISVLYYKKWTRLIVSKLLKRKYINLEGYRK